MHSIELVSLDSLFILWLTKSAKGISTKSHLSTRQGETNPQIAVIFVVFFETDQLMISCFRQAFGGYGADAESKIHRSVHAKLTTWRSINEAMGAIFGRWIDPPWSTMSYPTSPTRRGSWLNGNVFKDVDTKLRWNGVRIKWKDKLTWLLRPFTPFRLATTIKFLERTNVKQKPLRTTRKVESEGWEGDFLTRNEQTVVSLGYHQLRPINDETHPDIWGTARQ